MGIHYSTSFFSKHELWVLIRTAAMRLIGICAIAKVTQPALGNLLSEP